MLTQHIFDKDNNKAYENSLWKIPIFIGSGSSRRVVWLSEWNNGKSPSNIFS